MGHGFHSQLCDSQIFGETLPHPPQEAYPEAAIVGGVVMGRRVVAKRGQGALSNGRGVGALAISGNAPLFAMTCLDRNGGISWGSEM